MEEKQYLVAVILINYNSSHFTLQAVQSIRQHTASSIAYQIIVVDNNSRPDDYAKLSSLESFENVKLVRSRINLGFSGGNMYGVQFVKARYYYFLNNDCLFMNDCLGTLLTFCENDPNTGLCSGQMFNEQGQWQCNFDYLPTLSTKFLGVGLLRQLTPQRYPLKKTVHQTPLQVEVLSGSSLFVPAKVLSEVGGFDTTYFLYLEEEDIAFRIQQAGYNIYLVPEAKYQHLGGKSTNRNLVIEKEFYISYLYFYRKSYGRWKTGLLQLFLFFKLGRKTLRHIHNGKLALFVLKGAPLQQSLRHQQKMSI